MGCFLPSMRFIGVPDANTTIRWGPVNKPMSPEVSVFCTVYTLLALAAHSLWPSLLEGPPAGATRNTSAQRIPTSTTDLGRVNILGRLPNLLLVLCLANDSGRADVVFARPSLLAEVIGALLGTFPPHIWAPFMHPTRIARPTPAWRFLADAHFHRTGFAIATIWDDADMLDTHRSGRSTASVPLTT